ITYTYYVDGNLHKMDYINTPASGMAQERDVTYNYSNEYNRVTQRLDDAVTWNYAYHPYSTNLSTASNGAGQLWKDDGPWSNDTITYTYDDLGRVATRTVPGAHANLLHTETYTYDSLERLKQEVNPLA